MREKKRLIPRKSELIVLLVSCCLVLSFWLYTGFRKKEHIMAGVYIGGDQVMVIDLSKEERNRVIDLSPYSVPGKLEVEGYRIRFIQVACPDHICEKTGWIGRDGESAVCMPNRAAVLIYSG